VTTRELLKAHRAQPFQAFTLHLADGRAFPVPHPEWMWMSPGSGRIVVVADGRGSFDLIDLLLVTSLEMKPPSSSAA
jgi:hypothetical protein